MSRLYGSVAASSLGSLLFGYHLSELNAPEQIMVCAESAATANCIPMTSSGLGLVNGMNAVGGCAGAMIAGPVAAKFGRRFSLNLSSLLLIIGPCIMYGSPNVSQLALGRLVSGLGAGISIVVVPVHISECSPVNLRGRLGSLVQISCVLGILLAQVLGLWYSTDLLWRRILAMGGVVALIMMVAVTVFVYESPKWLAMNGYLEQARTVLTQLRPADSGLDEIEAEISLWKAHGNDGVETRALLDDEQGTDAVAVEASFDKGTSSNVSVAEFILSPRYRKYLIATVTLMSIQQLVGINAIVFYGVSILSGALPSNYSRLINVFISIANVVMTVVATPAIDKYGRKPLLLLSCAGTAFSSTLLAFATLMSSEPGGFLAVLASIAATLFVVSFAIGCGPIPFIMVPELTPSAAGGTAQSVSQTVNWVMTFLIGFLFPIVKFSIGNWVFLAFSLTGILSFAFIWVYIPETKGTANAEEAWKE